MSGTRAMPPFPPAPPAPSAPGFTSPSGCGRPPSGDLARPSLALTGEVTASRWEAPPWTDAQAETTPPQPEPEPVEDGEESEEEDAA